MEELNKSSSQKTSHNIIVRREPLHASKSAESTASSGGESCSSFSTRKKSSPRIPPKLRRMQSVPELPLSGSDAKPIGRFKQTKSLKNKLRNNPHSLRESFDFSIKGKY